MAAELKEAPVLPPARLKFLIQVVTAQRGGKPLTLKRTPHHAIHLANSGLVTIVTVGGPAMGWRWMFTATEAADAMLQILLG